MPVTRIVLASIVTTLLASCATTRADRAAPGAVDIDVPAIARPAGETPEWWYRAGAAHAARNGAMSGRARNVILFVGDGMSLATVTAARILAGQRAGGPGEEHRLAWEHFPATAISKTYNTDAQTPDSAGTMTAMGAGIKTRAGVIGAGQAGKRGDCAESLKWPVLSLWQLAADAGLATGVVTTTRVTHATPAATFSHSPERNWENDTDLPAAAREAGCVDIARQLIESPHGAGPDVLLGGGRGNFMTVEQADPEYADKVGQRLDGRDLVAAWRQRHPGGTYVWNATDFASAPDGPLLGLFEYDHMQYEHDRPKDRAGEPSLADMTRAAIRRLAKDTDGYVLLVEGGRIDHAHHLGNAHRALTDTIALSDAVQAAVDASGDDTLIMVTADHSHTLSFAGYPARGNPIMGKVKGGAGENIDPEALALDATGQPYTTLSYANGPGYVGASAQQPEGLKTYEHVASGYESAKNGRPNLLDVDTTHPDYMQEAMVPMSAETHGGDDVGIWATGPGSEAVRGSLEQNVIHHLLLQATPRLRAAVCARTNCDASGVPVERVVRDTTRP